MLYPINIISGFSTTGLFSFERYKFPVNEFDLVDFEEYFKYKYNKEILLHFQFISKEQSDIIHIIIFIIRYYETNKLKSHL